MSEVLKPSLDDIVFVASADAIRQNAEEYDTTYGKFVRIGTLVLMPPLLICGPRAGYPRHLDLIEWGFYNPDERISQLIASASDESDEALINANKMLTDAGDYHILCQNQSATDVIIESESMDYGRASDEGRQNTVSILQKALGGTYLVNCYSRSL